MAASAGATAAPGPIGPPRPTAPTPPAPARPAGGWRRLRPSPAGVRGGARRLADLAGLHRSGVLLLVTGMLLALLGWPTHWLEPRVAAVFCLVTLLLAVGFTLYGTRYAVDFGVSQPRVVVGEPAWGRLVVANMTGRRALPARVDVTVGSQVATFHVPSLPTRGQHDGRFEIPTHHRGVMVVGPVRTVRGDPLGLSGRETRFTDTLEVFVHPRTVPLPGRRTGLVHDLEGHPSSQLSASDVSFHALREYVPGDDRRHVHWRSTARAGSLMVRQYEQTLQSRLALGLDLDADAWFGDAEFEQGVAIVGSLAAQAHRDENPLILFAGSEELAAVNRRRSLDELSRVQRTEGTSWDDLARSMRLRAAGASVAVLVTGSNVPLARLRSISSQFDVDTRVLAVQVDETSPVLVRSAGSTTVVRLPGLDELPPALRRAMQ